MTITSGIQTTISVEWRIPKTQTKTVLHSLRVVVIARDVSTRLSKEVKVLHKLLKSNFCGKWHRKLHIWLSIRTVLLQWWNELWSSQHYILSRIFIWFSTYVTQAGLTCAVIMYHPLSESIIHLKDHTWNHFLELLCLRQGMQHSGNDKILNDSQVLWQSVFKLSQKKSSRFSDGTLSVWKDFWIFLGARYHVLISTVFHISVQSNSKKRLCGNILHKIPLSHLRSTAWCGYRNPTFLALRCTVQSMLICPARNSTRTV